MVEETKLRHWYVYNIFRGQKKKKKKIPETKN